MLVSWNTASTFSSTASCSKLSLLLIKTRACRQAGKRHSDPSSPGPTTGQQHCNAAKTKTKTQPLNSDWVLKISSKARVCA
jgi:hypothetical protein